MLICSSCRRPYPADSLPHQCPACGGVYDLAALPPFEPAKVETGPDRSIWRYRHTFPLPPGAAPVSLGEGGTPLVAAEINGRTVHFKMESLNPSGSFKDRGSAVLAAWLKAHGVTEAVEDSSGNAGASFAAYAARAGIRAHIFVPESASGPKRAQIETYGADVIRVPGPRSESAAAVLRAVEAGAVYASHNYIPVGLAGMATAAYEIVEQLGRAPGAVITPVGNGSLLVGLYRGFKALQAAGSIRQLPRIIGVQALACAPLWALITGGREKLLWVTEGATLAEGIRVLRPVRGDAVLAAVAESGGALLAVPEEEIAPGRKYLAQMGFYVENTAAVVWHALRQIVAQLSGEIVIMLTGAGLKTP